MTKTIWKLFLAWNFDKEERWLNEMSAQGWQLTKPGPFRYSFKKGEANQYQYALEYLDVSGTKMEDYFSFLEETGVEVLGHYLNWTYYRKAYDGKPFEIFSDSSSKTTHLKRILKIMFFFFLLEGFFFVTNCIDQLNGIDSSSCAVILFLGFTSLILGIGCLCLWKKIKGLE